MYSISLERIPLPNFSVYLCFTVLMLVTSLSHIAYHQKFNLFVANQSSVVNQNSSSHHPFLQQLYDACLSDTWCFWSIINMGYSCLLFIGLSTQYIFFGELRLDEQVNIREKFWNFVFYKLVFIYGILHVRSMHEMLLWATWCSVLCFLHLLVGLIKDRLEFVIQSNDIPACQHLKVCLLLVLIFMMANFLSLVSVYVGLRSSVNLMFFMLAEVAQLFVTACHVTSGYAAYFYIEAEANKSGKRCRSYHNVIIFHCDLVFTCIGHTIDFFHYVHMFIWSQSYINMSTLIMGIHLQYVYNDLLRLYRSHLRYVYVARSLASKFPIQNVSLSVKLISCLLFHKKGANCPICWEELQSDARLLNCNHTFHDPCLRSWLQDNNSCPTCRSCILVQTTLDNEPTAEAHPDVGEPSETVNAGREALELTSRGTGSHEIGEATGCTHRKRDQGSDSDEDAEPVHEPKALLSDMLLLNGILKNDLSRGQIRHHHPQSGGSSSLETADGASSSDEPHELLARLHTLSESFKDSIEQRVNNFHLSTEHPHATLSNQAR